LAYGSNSWRAHRRVPPRRLNLSKATVTNQIQALENALGARLSNRTTRRVGLTEIGRTYYERCVQILHDLEEADETAGAQQATPRGQLRVHCQQGIVEFVTPGRECRFACLRGAGAAAARLSNAGV
jgi:DNA-binding transcriptional LysR family regulator